MPQLGSTGLNVSPMGFGCMGITAAYGVSMDDDAAFVLLKGAYDMGYRHFDTAEIYATKDKHNEVQLGRFLQTVPRDSFTVATKFMPKPGGRCDLDTVRKALNASLKRLGLEYVDLYYCHRMPATLQLAKAWMHTMTIIVRAGKVKHVGLSEVGPEWLRQMHAIHPIACVQQEWSLLTRNLEDVILPVYRELGIGIVAYSPLARNLLVSPTAAMPTDWRANNPRYSKDNFTKNQELAGKIAAIAQAKGTTAAQLSLAWLYCKARELGVTMVPIPGTTKLQNARDNIASLATALTGAEMIELEALGALVAGDRATEEYQRASLEGQQSKL